jgi:Xaa-Pro dipeptidase
MRQNHLELQEFCAQMRKAGFEAVVTSSPNGVFHTTGALIITHNPARDRLAFSIITAGGRQVLAVCKIEESLCRQDSWVDDVRTYVEFEELPTALLARTLRDLGLSAAKIGIDLDYIRDKFFSELVQEAPSVNFVSADALLRQMQVRKPYQLIERMAEAATRIGVCIDEAMVKGAIGKSERHIRNEVRRRLAEGGADGSYLVVASGPNVMTPEHRAGNRVVKEGDILTVDVSASYDGYAAEAAKSIIVGGDGACERALAKVYSSVVSTVKAGVAGSEVYAQAEAAAREEGCALAAGPIGYAAAFGGRERPFIASGSPEKISCGATIALDLAIKPRRGGLMRTKSVWLVSDEGATCLDRRWRDE